MLDLSLVLVSPGKKSLWWLKKTYYKVKISFTALIEWLSTQLIKGQIFKLSKKLEEIRRNRTICPVLFVRMIQMVGKGFILRDWMVIHILRVSRGKSSLSHLAIYTLTILFQGIQHYSPFSLFNGAFNPSKKMDFHLRNRIEFRFSCSSKEFHFNNSKCLVVIAPPKKNIDLAAKSIMFTECEVHLSLKVYDDIKQGPRKDIKY